jgi:hypothetical protein
MYKGTMMEYKTDIFLHEYKLKTIEWNEYLF